MVTTLPPDEIVEQQRLLAAYRRRLTVYLRREAELSADVDSPPDLLEGIADARRNIARIKAQLRAARVAIDDEPNDVPVSRRTMARHTPPRRSGALQDEPHTGRWTVVGGVAIVAIMLAFVIGRVIAAPALAVPENTAQPPAMQSFTVEGAAMEPTFAQGQVVPIDPITPATLRRGDVVLVDRTGRPFLKRVVALPGDALSIRDGKVFVNDTPLDEPYVHGAATTCRPGDPCADGRLIKLPSDSVFVLGDNRANSSDSRELGPVPLVQIKGRAR